MNEELVQFPVRLPKSDHKALKVLAAQRGTSSTEMIRRIVRQILAEAGAEQNA